MNLQNKAFTLVELIVVITILAVLSTILISQVFSYNNEKVGDIACVDIKNETRYPNLSPILIGKINLIGDKLNNKYKQKDEIYKDKIYDLYIKLLNENIIKTKYTDRQKEILLRIGDYFICKKEELNNLDFVEEIFKGSELVENTEKIIEYKEKIGIEAKIKKESGLKNLEKNGDSWEIITIHPKAKGNSMELELSTEIGKTYKLQINVDKEVKLWFSDGSKSHETITELNKILTTNFKATVKNQRIWIQPQVYGTTKVSDLSVNEKIIIFNQNNNVEEKPDKTIVDNRNNDNSKLFSSDLPTKRYNVLDYGLKGDGKTDNSKLLLNMINNNTEITNIYFPSGYTFAFTHLTIPEKINAIFGGATIKFIKESQSPEVWTYGFAFSKTADNLIIDGLTFTSSENVTSKQGHGYLLFSSGKNQISDGIEIRNNKFIGVSGTRHNFIKFFGKDKVDVKRIYKNIRIYNNYMENCQGYFDIEFIAYNDSDKKINSDTFPGTKIYNNIIKKSRGHGSISIVYTISDFEVFNNQLNEVYGMGIEVLSANTLVRNNLLTNIYGDPFQIGLITKKYPDNLLLNTRSIFRNNHIEVATKKWDHVLYAYGGGNALIHDNFLKGVANLNIQISDSKLSVPSFYNNTVVNDGLHVGLMVNNDTGNSELDGGNVYNNDIYTKAGSTGIYLSNIKSTTKIDNNKVFIIGSNTGNCLKSPNNIYGTNTNNSCFKSYNGTIPQSRVNAGLINPDILGPYKGE